MVTFPKEQINDRVLFVLVPRELENLEFDALVGGNAWHVDAVAHEPFFGRHVRSLSFLPRCLSLHELVVRLALRLRAKQTSEPDGFLGDGEVTVANPIDAPLPDVHLLGGSVTVDAHTEWWVDGIPIVGFWIRRNPGP